MSQPFTALLIAGMHRSGTSFLGESCGALGFALPRDAGGPAEDNPRGHFEPQAVVALNDAILAEHGAFWLRVGPVALPAPDDALRRRMDKKHSLLPSMLALQSQSFRYLRSFGRHVLFHRIYQCKQRGRLGRHFEMDYTLSS